MPRIGAFETESRAVDLNRGNARPPARRVPEDLATPPGFYCARRGIGPHEWRRQLEGTIRCGYCEATLDVAAVLERARARARR